MKRKFFAVLAAAVMIMSIASCGSNTTETSGASALENEAADENNSKLAYWEGIDRNTVVAHVDGAGNAEEFNITFGEFYSEYLYYLLSYGIEDDMSPAYAQSCESFRENIITYLEYEHIFLHIAKEEGISEEALSEEEKKQIQTSADTTFSNFLSRYTDMAKEALDEGATEAELRAKEEEMLRADLTKAELDDGIFYKWELNDYIQSKLMEKICEGITVTDEQVNEMYADYVQMAKDAFAEDAMSYESNQTFTSVYVPEGTRTVDQILIMFDEETRTAISNARSAGNDEEADRLRNEAFESQLSEKAENIKSLIDSGTDFFELQETYNEDTADVSYNVIIGSKLYVKEFSEAALAIPEIGGVSPAVISDYGAHFIRYSGDRVISEEETAGVLESMKGFLEYQEKTARQEAAYEEWFARFPYVEDNELLKITEDTEETETETELVS